MWAGEVHTQYDQWVADDKYCVWCVCMHVCTCECIGVCVYMSVCVFVCVCMCTYMWEENEVKDAKTAPQSTMASFSSFQRMVREWTCTNSHSQTTKPVSKGMEWTTHSHSQSTTFSEESLRVKRHKNHLWARRTWSCTRGISRRTSPEGSPENVPSPAVQESGRRTCGGHQEETCLCSCGGRLGTLAHPTWSCSVNFCQQWSSVHYSLLCIPVLQKPPKAVPVKCSSVMDELGNTVRRILQYPHAYQVGDALDGKGGTFSVI